MSDTKPKVVWELNVLDIVAIVLATVSICVAVFLAYHVNASRDKLDDIHESIKDQHETIKAQHQEIMAQRQEAI